MVARGRHFGVNEKHLGAEVHAAARRPLQRRPGHSVEAVTAEHEVTRDLVAVGQHDHRSLGDADRSGCASESDVAADGAKLVDQIGHQ
jgi:hypothetical protein